GRRALLRSSRTQGGSDTRLPPRPAFYASRKQESYKGARAGSAFTRVFDALWAIAERARERDFAPIVKPLSRLRASRSATLSLAGRGEHAAALVAINSTLLVLRSCVADMRDRRDLLGARAPSCWSLGRSEGDGAPVGATS